MTDQNVLPHASPRVNTLLVRLVSFSFEENIYFFSGGVKRLFFELGVSVALEPCILQYSYFFLMGKDKR
jgi:hypothetical protein